MRGVSRWLAVAVSVIPTAAHAQALFDGFANATECDVWPTFADIESNITVVTDECCIADGIGCVTDQCRYCRLDGNEEYDNLMFCSDVTPTACEALLNPSEVVPDTFVLTCASSVSPGDAGVGINIVTDLSCVQGGVGCTSDVCRFCQVWQTVQSQSFKLCSSIDTSSGNDIHFMEIPVYVDDAPGVVVAATDQPTLDLISFGTTTPTSAPATASTPAPTPAPTTPAPTTPAPTTKAPSTPAPTTPAPTTSAPTTPAPTTPAPTTPTPTTPVPTTPSPTTPAPTTKAPTTPAPTTPAPTTPAPTTPAPTTPAPTTTAPATANACSKLVASGDVAVGISAFVDSSCANGGLGCFSTTCRYCQTTTTPQSQNFVQCPATTTPAPTTKAPTPAPTTPAPTTKAPTPTPTTPKPTTVAPTTPPPTTPAPTTPKPTTLAPTTPPPTTPAPTTPTPTTVPPTTAPTTTSPSSNACSALVASGDVAVGISAYVDTACQTGGLGCFSTSCRYCKTVDTPQSSQFLACPVSNSCVQSVSSGDASVGISAITDTTCQLGGLGCFSTTCRYCKLYDSPQSQNFAPCSSLL